MRVPRALGAAVTAAVFVFVALFLPVEGCRSPSAANPPRIDSLSPASGPTGSLVTVAGDRFGSGGTVLFDGVALATQGTGSPLVFTVPYGATVGNHDVAVRVSGITSTVTPFQVTQVQAAATPALDGFEVGYFALGPAGDESTMTLVVFGTGFDTNCVVEFDGVQVTSFLPGLPAGSLLGAFTGAAVLPGFPPAMYGRALGALLTDANLPALGSAHNARVRNTVTNALSNQLAVAIPGRDVLVEMDRIDTVAWPPVAIDRNNLVNTLRRPYTNAGLLIDARLDAAVTDPQAGAAFSDADVTNFFNNNDNLRTEVFAGEWYFHVSLVSSRVEPNPAFTTFGRMFDTANREGMVVFVSNVTTQQYLRTLLHEMGHGFNLSHCEGDATPNFNAMGQLTGFNPAGTTIMNQTRALGANFVYAFSNASQTHLTTHALNEVQPGSGNLPFNSAMRVEGTCGF